MTDRNDPSRDGWTAADWLRHAAELLRRIAAHATPGPWRWGDRDVAGGALERHRTTLEHAPIHATFPTIRQRDDHGEAVLPGLRDPLDLLANPVESIYPHMHANALWITVFNPSIAEPLAALLDSLADSAEQILKGGSVDHEPYLSAVTLAKRIIEAAQDSPPRL